MRLESLLSLIDAKLCSHPTIQSFNEIVVRPSKVTRGDLYIAVNATLDDIDLAIANGAYGIIYDLPLLITDEEIAWLKVPHVREAEFKLLRFHLVQKRVKTFYADTSTIAYIKMLKNTNELLIIEDELSSVSMKLWNTRHNQTLVIREQEALSTLFPTAKPIKNLSSFISIYPVTPFESDITLENSHYKRLRLPVALALYFSQAVSFLDKEEIPYTITNLAYPKSCDIVSCDKHLNIKEFGQGVKTLIFLDSDELISNFAQSIEDYAPWIHYTIFLSKNKKILGYNNITAYSDQQNCIEGLKNNLFDYALVVGQERSLLELVPKPLQQSLF